MWNLVAAHAGDVKFPTTSRDRRDRNPRNRKAAWKSSICATPASSERVVAEDVAAALSGKQKSGDEGLSNACVIDKNLAL